MMTQIEQIIIQGGGSSIKELMDDNLFERLINSCLLGVNFSFRDYLPTALCCADFKFYSGKIKPIYYNNKLIKNAYDDSFRKELKNLPLIIAPGREDLLNNITEKNEKVRMDNTLFLNYLTAHQYYGKKQNKENSIYGIDLSGIWALGVACKLNPKEIYLLGFDFGDFGNGTHYYNHTKHRGIGAVSRDWYNNNQADYYFMPFVKDYSNIKIYNVSLKSKITCFEKINKESFFNKIKRLPNNLSQEALRKQISYLLTPYLTQHSC